MNLNENKNDSSKILNISNLEYPNKKIKKRRINIKIDPL